MDNKSLNPPSGLALRNCGNSGLLSEKHDVIQAVRQLKQYKDGQINKPNEPHLYAKNPTNMTKKRKEEDNYGNHKVHTLARR